MCCHLAMMFDDIHPLIFLPVGIVLFLQYEILKYILIFVMLRLKGLCPIMICYQWDHRQRCRLHFEVVARSKYYQTCPQLR